MINNVEPLHNKIKQLERLLEVGRNLSAMLDLDPLLQTIIDEAASLTYSQEASILLYDFEEEKLRFVAAPWYKREDMQKIHIPLDKSIAGAVYSQAEPMVVQDVKRDPRHFSAIDNETSFSTENLLAVPLMFQGKPTGVLTAVNKLGEQHFTEDDIFVLETLASQASIAINNASLLQQSQQAYDNLSELDRMKSDFIAITSHELRTPLGLILGHATFLHEMIPDDLKNQMDVIVRSSVRLKSIVEDLSKVNNFQTGQARLRWREVNINELLEEVVQNFRDEAESKGIDFKLNVPEEALMMTADGEKIGIAVSHLVSNAITFTDEGAVIVSAEELTGFIRISISDTGIGIPEGDWVRIFERFYQVEDHMTRRHGGMGLGLSVAKMMVEMHHGRIALTSREGEGTVFNVLFPLNSHDMTAASDLFIRP